MVAAVRRRREHDRALIRQTQHEDTVDIGPEPWSTMEAHAGGQSDQTCVGGGGVARILVSSMPFAGHVAPLAAVAAELVRPSSHDG